MILGHVGFSSKQGLEAAITRIFISTVYFKAVIPVWNQYEEVWYFWNKREPKVKEPLKDGGENPGDDY